MTNRLHHHSVVLRFIGPMSRTFKPMSGLVYTEFAAGFILVHVHMDMCACGMQLSFIFCSLYRALPDGDFKCVK